MHQRRPRLLSRKGAFQTWRRTDRQLQVHLQRAARQDVASASTIIDHLWWFTFFVSTVHSPDPTAEEKYDFKTIQNIDCYNTDFCVKVRHGMRYWNMTVQWWLHHYIYPNAPFTSYTLRYVQEVLLVDPFVVFHILILSILTSLMVS